MEVNNIFNNEKYREYSIGVLFESSKQNLNFIKQFINPKTKVVISDESFTIGGVYSYICTLLSLVNNKYIVNSNKVSEIDIEYFDIDDIPINNINETIQTSKISEKEQTI